ncbi:type II secretion system F family protein [Dietzia cercidiphylli]|jgi:pilus assembly protein TadC|uniref:type II secretion system F family protein n=1 Tax=Dietzia cercidiphylli TaxID=498199 RepID=UPI003F7CDBDA
MTGMMILAAIGAGLGVFSVIVYFLPSQPDLRQVVTRQSTVSSSVIEAPAQDRPGGRPVDPTAEGIELTSSDQAAAKVGMRASATLQALPFVKIPVSDLYVIRKPVSVFLGEKVLMSVIGLVGPMFVTGALALVGISLPVAVPAVVALFLAAVLFFVPDSDVQSTAAKARVEFRHALSVYVDLVAMSRRAGVGATQALEEAAIVGDSWVVRRIDEVLQEAARLGRPPWDALKQLATRLEVQDLADLADIMTLSGEYGTASEDALRAKSKSLRNSISSESAGEAKSVTEQLALPTSAMAFTFMIILFIPPLIRLAFS